MKNNKMSFGLVWIFIFYIINTLVVSAQDMKLKCGDDVIQFSNGSDSHFEMVVLCPYKEYDSDKNIPNNIKDINSNYLNERVGKDFLKKVKLRSVYVIDFSNPNLALNPEWIITADKRVKFAFSYYFKVQDEMNYYFTTVFDSSGKLLSSHQLPLFKRNPEFDKIISVCNAKKIAESDSILKKPIEGISLQYGSDSLNSFVWKIKMAPVRNDKNIVVADNYLILNANSGEVVERRSQKVITVRNKTISN